MVIYFFVYKITKTEPMLNPLVEDISVEAVEVKEYFGTASWYGTGENECLGCSQNRTMANGQRLDDNKMTVACGLRSSCKYLKMGDRVLITNLDNSKQVEAVVTDKGGLRPGRILDVSKAVKSALEMKGIGKVKISIIK